MSNFVIRLQFKYTQIMKTNNETSAHETNTSTNTSTNRYDLSSFHELFKNFASPSEIIPVLEELRLHYLELSLEAEQSHSLTGYSFALYAHENAGQHSHYLSQLIERLGQVCENK